MSKGLKSLKYLKERISDNAIFRGCLEDIEKELKALETLKGLDFFGLEKDENGLYWLIFCGQGIGITKEQYELLKEAML